LKKLLIFIDWFDPAYKAGGPITAAQNFVENMSTHYELFVFTGDRDLGDAQPLPGITVDKWIERNDRVKIFYASPANLALAKIKEHIRLVQPAIIYLHSLFSKSFSIFPLWLHRFQPLPQTVVLAPRGMLRQSALRHKAFKKKVFLAAFRLLGLHKGVVFHATDQTEYQDVQRHFGKNNKLVVAPDFTSLPVKELLLPAKNAGHLELVFVGRIHPIKNLDFLLQALRHVKSKVNLTIIATIEDRPYWQKCEALMQQMPANVQIDFKGSMHNKEIKNNLLQNHVFVLPTRGENFGHAIFEALAAGRPVLISDQTLWRGLAEKKAGWDLPLQQDKFVEAIEQAAAMTEQQMNEWCNGAWNFCKKYLESSGIKEQYLKLFS
jgi:glycosyltransferase involved in cell wall biosynthesis